MSVVEAIDVSLEVGDARLVDGVDLAASAGELVVVVGPNGAGKTSLLRMLSGEVVPTAGEVRLDGRPIGGFDRLELARRRAVLPQQTLLRFAFRCLDVVMMGRHPHGGADAHRHATEAMATTDSLQFAARSYPSLSGGEQTRVSLARVLAQAAPVLFLDEPTGSLDLGHQHLMMATLRALADDGATVVAVLHDLNLAGRFADRVAMIDGGRVVDDGPTADVLTAERIGSVYGIPVEVIAHPTLGSPVVLPVGEGR